MPWAGINNTADIAGDFYLRLEPARDESVDGIFKPAELSEKHRRAGGQRRTDNNLECARQPV